MAYVSLYRKYRPQSFAEVVGQRHVTQTLANALAEDRLHHAYLFTGPRGTGKTSTARILAKAVNCVEGPTPVPCQVCELCVGITEGSSVDVVELDMASHGGVDDARELRERALFAPALGRRKVYILDEVHMASSAAFNALLKLIEEPPPHVLFAMATTDPQKVLPTIMSRVQRLDLRRVSGDELAGHVRRVAALEGLQISDDAVEAVVRASDGAVRDCLSILEQVAAFAGGDVDADHVAHVLGHTPSQRTFETVALLAARDLAGLLAVVQGLLDEGHDLRRFAVDLVVHLRDLLVLQVAPERDDLVEATVERRGRLRGQASVLPRETLVRAVDVLAETITEMRRGPARLPLELALAKLALPETTDDSGALADRLARLEAMFASGSVGAAAPSTHPGDWPDAMRSLPPPSRSRAVLSWSRASQDRSELQDRSWRLPPQPSAVPEPAAPPAEVTLERILGRWSEVLDAVKQRSRRLHGIYRSATPVALEGGTLELAFSSAWHAEQGARPENVESFRDVSAQLCGLELGVRATVAGDGQSASTTSQPRRLADPDEEFEAGQAEVVGVEELDEEEATSRAAALLRERLGAEAVEER